MILKDIRITQKMSTDEINFLIKDYIQLADIAYKGNDFSHNWKCKCGNHIIGRRWSNIRLRGDILCGACVNKKYEKRYKEGVAKKEGYEFIRSYFVNDVLPDGIINKGCNPKIEIKHTYCGNSYIISPSSFINSGYECDYCCREYEKSIAYYIEVELKKKLEDCWDFDKNTIAPHTVSKASGKKAYFFCQNKKYHGSSERTIRDFYTGQGCNYCANKVHKYDSLGYLYPNIASMIVNNVNVFSLAPQTNKNFNLKCPKCGNIVTQKLSNIINQGFSCKICSDGISVPEKFIYNILIQLDIKVERQKLFSWSDKKRYDFFLPNNNIIIEAHGLQHYRECESFTKKSLKDMQENDLLKQNLAINNGILDKNYIVINCSSSDFIFLKNNIIHSLQKIINIQKVDWEKAWGESQNSIIIKAWDLYNKGCVTIDIASKLQVSRATIIKYLKKGAVINKCTYNPKMEMRRSANNNRIRTPISFQINNEIKIFLSITELAKFLNTYHGTIKSIIENNGKINAYSFAHKKARTNFERFHGGIIKFLD